MADPGEDEPVPVGSIESTTCGVCNGGKQRGAALCHLCKNKTVGDATRAARATVNEVKYINFMEASSTRIAKRALKDLGEEVERANMIREKKQKLQEPIHALMNVLPGILATDVKNIKNPFAVNKEVLRAAAVREAQQHNLPRAPAQQLTVALQQEIADHIKNTRDKDLQQMRLEFDQQRQRDREELQRERDELQRQREGLARQHEPGAHVNTIGDQQRKEQRQRAADAAENREVENLVNQLMHD